MLDRLKGAFKKGEDTGLVVQEKEGENNEGSEQLTTKINITEEDIERRLGEYSRGSVMSAVQEEMDKLDGSTTFEIIDYEVLPTIAGNNVTLDLGLHIYPRYENAVLMTICVDFKIDVELRKDGTLDLWGTSKTPSLDKLDSVVAFGDYIQERYGKDEIQVNNSIEGVQGLMAEFIAYLDSKTPKLESKRGIEGSKSLEEPHKQLSEDGISLAESKQLLLEESQDMSIEGNKKRLKEDRLRLLHRVRKIGNEDDALRLKRLILNLKTYEGKIDFKPIDHEVIGKLVVVSGNKWRLILTPNYLINGETNEVFYDKYKEDLLKGVYPKLLDGLGITKENAKELAYINTVLNVYEVSNDLRRKLL